MRKLAAILISLLTACGGGGSTDDEPSKNLPIPNCAASANQCK